MPTRRKSDKNKVKSRRCKKSPRRKSSNFNKKSTVRSHRKKSQAFFQHSVTSKISGNLCEFLPRECRSIL